METIEGMGTDEQLRRDLDELRAAVWVKLGARDPALFTALASDPARVQTRSQPGLLISMTERHDGGWRLKADEQAWIREHYAGPTID